MIIHYFSFKFFFQQVFELRIYYQQQFLLNMNYNFCHNFNSAQFFPIPISKLISDNQITLFSISTALKKSLELYQQQWKINQTLPKHQSNKDTKTGETLSNKNSNKNILSEKITSLSQQNKKSKQKLSYNSGIQKNEKQQWKNIENVVNIDEKICSYEHKITEISNQSGKVKKQKIIHQGKRKQLNENRSQCFRFNGIIVDMNQSAYIRQNSLSKYQIEEKREKLLLRKVLNWKQIDKKISYRKMQLKKLLN